MLLAELVGNTMIGGRTPVPVRDSSRPESVVGRGSANVVRVVTTVRTSSSLEVSEPGPVIPSKKSVSPRLVELVVEEESDVSRGGMVVMVEFTKICRLT